MEKGRYTLEEIGRQDEALKKTREQFPAFKEIIKEVKSEGFNKVLFIGCGTSYYIAASASAYFAKFNSINCDYLASFEFYKNTDYYVKSNDKVLLVPFTRVASTTETMIAVKKGVSLPNVKSLQVTCDDYSFQYSTWSLFIPGVQENSVVMTSTTTAMLYAAMFFAAEMAGNAALSQQLLALPEDVTKNKAGYAGQMKALAEKHSALRVFVGLGSGTYYGLAGEASVKVKEMTLTPTECCYSLEYRHGPISIADDKALYAYFVSENTCAEDARLIAELKALGSCVVAIGSVTEEIRALADVSISTELSEDVSLPELIIPVQYLGAYLAIAKGYDPDTPKNLTKAVIL